MASSALLCRLSANISGVVRLTIAILVMRSLAVVRPTGQRSGATNQLLNASQFGASESPIRARPGQLHNCTLVGLGRSFRSYDHMITPVSCLIWHSAPSWALHILTRMRRGRLCMIVECRLAWCGCTASGPARGAVHTRFGAKPPTCPTMLVSCAVVLEPAPHADVPWPRVIRFRGESVRSLQESEVACCV